MKPTLIVLVGHSGAGKTSLARELGEKYDFGVLSEDNFVFKMNPRSLVERVARQVDREIGMGALVRALEVYFEYKKTVILEGAFVDGPLYLRDFREMAQKSGYGFKSIMLTADRKQRVKRKKRKNGHVISEVLDQRLRKAADDLGYREDSVEVDTTKQKLKQTLEKIEEILGLLAD